MERKKFNFLSEEQTPEDELEKKENAKETIQEVSQELKSSFPEAPEDQIEKLAEETVESSSSLLSKIGSKTKKHVAIMMATVAIGLGGYKGFKKLDAYMTDPTHKVDNAILARQAEAQDTMDKFNQPIKALNFVQAQSILDYEHQVHVDSIRIYNKDLYNAMKSKAEEIRNSDKFSVIQLPDGRYKVAEAK